MAMNNDAASKHGGSGGDDVVQRVVAMESRLTVIEKTMVTTEVFQRELGAVRGEIGVLRSELHREIGAVRGEVGALRDEMHVGFGAQRQEMQKELGAVRVEIARIPFELVKWLIALSGIAAAIATTVYNLWFR